MTIDLINLYGLEIPPIQLKENMVLAIYHDDGPTGFCGQSMNITCPDTSIHIFKNEDLFREYANVHNYRRGIRAQLRWCTIGSGGTGQFNLEIHE